MEVKNVELWPSFSKSATGKKNLRFYTYIWTGFLIFIRSDINEKSNAEKLISLL